MDVEEVIGDVLGVDLTLVDTLISRPDVLNQQRPVTRPPVVFYGHSRVGHEGEVDQP